MSPFAQAQVRGNARENEIWMMRHLSLIRMSRIRIFNAVGKGDNRSFAHEGIHRFG
jgi:hypothetical protein